MGAGVLDLPNALAWLGWVAGLTLMAAFYLITLYTSKLLAETIDVKGRRAQTYREAALNIMGPRASSVLSFLQLTTLVLVTLAYFITAGTSGKAGLLAGGHYGADQAMWPIILVFGGIEMILSQMPNLHSAWITSTIGAAMAFGYSTIALGLCSAQAGNGMGTIQGITDVSTSDKVFGVMNGIGQVAFAFNFAAILVEVQNTLREPPSALISMKKATDIGLGIVFGYYLGVAITGYLAFGNTVSGSVLSQPGIGPVWVIVLSNIMVFVHMMCAVQLLAQPVYEAVESSLLRHWPRGPTATHPRLTRLVWRCAYVAVLTFFACLVPFFQQIVGLVGSMFYWPTVTVFPILMWLGVHPAGRSRWWGMHTLNIVVLVVCVVAVVGSVSSLVNNAKSFGVFQ